MSLEEQAAQLRLQLNQLRVQSVMQTANNVEAKKNRAFVDLYRQNPEAMADIEMTETQQLLLQRDQLEQQLRDIEAQIKAQAPQVELTESIREEQAPPQELRQEKTGFFASVAKWFRKTFSKNASKRLGKVKEMEKKDATYATLREQNYAEGLKEMKSNPDGMGNLKVPREIILEQYLPVEQAFIEAGWVRKGETAEDIISARTELQAFFRELGNADCFAPVEDRTSEKELFPLDVGEISREDIMYVLSHRTSEGVERILKPLLEFDIQEALESFPIHKCKTLEECKEVNKRQYYYLHHLMGRIQWAEKFALDVMTPELRQRFEIATDLYNKFEFLMQIPGSAMEECVPEMMEELNDIPHLVSLSSRITSLTGIYEKHTTEHDANKTTYTIEELKEIGLLGANNLPVEGADLFVSKRDTKNRDVEISKEEMEQMKNGSTEYLASLMEQIKSFSLLGEDGRPRLLGLESGDVLEKHGAADLEYYHSKALAAFKLVQILSKETPAKQSLSEKKRALLIEQAWQVMRVYDTVKSRFRKPTARRKDTKNSLARKQKDPFWAQRQQANEMNLYEKTHFGCYD